MGLSSNNNTAWWPKAGIILKKAWVMDQNIWYNFIILIIMANWIELEYRPTLEMIVGSIHAWNDDINS